MITHEYPPIGGGGGKAAQDLCRGFVKAGHIVQVLTTHFAGQLREESDLGVSIHRIPSYRKKMYQASFFSMLIFLVRSAWIAFRLVPRWKPDLLHIHFAVPAGPVGWLMQKIYGTPYIITVQLGDIPGGTPEKTDRWFKFVYPFTPPIWKSAAQVIAVSQFTRRLALNHYQVPIQVIPNGVQLEPLQPEMITCFHPVKIVFAGRFIEQKDPVRIVRILEQIKYLDWDCVMIGDGSLRSEVEAAIQQCGLAARFELPGWLTPEEVRERLRQSDLLLMPSKSEGLPLVGVQALAAGLCLVVSKIGGFEDLVEQGVNGFMLPNSDDNSWVEALREIISKPDQLLQYRQHSLARARIFTIDHVVQQYLRLFERMIGEKN